MIDLGSFWGCVGRLFVVLGLLGGVFWRSWRVLGGSWEALGGLEAVLDRSWAALSRHGLLRVVLGPAPPYGHPPLGGPRGAKMRPKWDPRGTKIDVKNEVEKDALEDRLGAVLGRSWVVWGVVLGPWKRSRHYACRCFVKIHVFEKMRCQEAT